MRWSEVSLKKNYKVVDKNVKSSLGYCACLTRSLTSVKLLIFQASILNHEVKITPVKAFSTLNNKSGKKRYRLNLAECLNIALKTMDIFVVLAYLFTVCQIYIMLPCCVATSTSCLHRTITWIGLKLKKKYKSED